MPSEPKYRVTIVDVAKSAGVSRQTVSRVLNNSGSVSESARKKVLSAIQELKYSPDPIARSMVSQRTHMIGVLTRTFRITPSTIIEGAETWARDHGYQTIISGSSNSPYGEPIHSSLISRNWIEGMVVVYQGGIKDNYKIIEEFRGRIPIVTIGYGAQLKDVHTISLDHFSGAKKATQHLINVGHTRIAVISGMEYYYNSIDRLNGFLAALKENNIEFIPELKRIGDWTVESGYYRMAELLDSGLDFTAVLSQNDWMAIGCMRAIKERGMRIPEDISIIGFDNSSPSPYVDPPLSTVDYPGRILGSLCAKYVIQCIRNKTDLVELTEEEKVNLESRLIIRESCGYKKLKGTEG